MKLRDVAAAANMLLIGESGRGKTYQLGLLSQLAPSVLLTADRRGLDTIRRFSDAEPEIELAESWSDPWALYDRLSAHSSAYRMLLLDDLGALQDVIGLSIQKHARGRDEERQRSDVREKAIRGQLLAGGRRLQQSQWGELDIAMNAFLTELLLLPYKLIAVTVLEDVREHPRTGAAQVYPNLVGGIRNDLTARFSLVANLFIHEEDGRSLYCMSCRPHSRLPNKSRYGVPRTWINPTPERVLRYINGNEGKGDEETPQEQRVGSGALQENHSR